MESRASKASAVRPRCARRWPTAWGALLSITLALSCSDPTRLPLASRIQMDPSADFLLVGEALQLNAKVYDEDDNVLGDRPVHWSSSDTTVAVVDMETGLVRAIKVGRSGITARHGTFAQSLPIEVISGEVHANRVALDLGTLGGDNASATAINRTSHIVGWSETPTGQRHAFVWKRVGVTLSLFDLGTLAGDSASGAQGINASGEIVGFSRGTSLRAVFWTPAGQGVDLGNLGGKSAIAYAVNDSGQAVGESVLPSGDRRAFRWSHALGRMIQLYPLPGDSASSAYAINTAGHVAGVSRGKTTRAVLWMRDGAILNLGTIGNDSVSIAYGINDEDQVVGVVTARVSACPCRAFIWTRAAGLRAVPIAGAEPVLHSINNLGVSAGEAVTGSGSRYALVVSADHAEERVGILPNGFASAALAINEGRRAVGWSIDANGKSRAVLFGIYP